MKQPSPGTLRKTPILLLGSSMVLGIGCLIMHTLGILGLSEEFGVAFSPSSLTEISARLAAGPAMTTLVAGILLILHVGRKPLPKWLALIGGLGAAYSVNALRGGLAHDLGHVVFNRCAGSPYGAIVFWSSLASATSIALATALSTSFRPHPSSGSRPL